MSDLHLTHTLSGDGSTLHLTVAGRLSIENAGELQHLLLEQGAVPREIKIDLTAVESIDLAGLQVICSACRTMLDSSRQFNFAAAPSAAVSQAVSLIGLQKQTVCKHNNNLPCIWCGGIN